MSFARMKDFFKKSDDETKNEEEQKRIHQFLLAAKDLPHKLRLLTMNTGCLPTFWGKQFNDLAPNMDRANIIEEDLSQRKEDDQYGIIAFQEVWDTAVADYLQEELKAEYPYCVRGVNGDKNYGVIKFVRGGLMIFSKYPILESHAEVYPNLMFGVESFGEKGFVGIKCALNDKYFVTIYTSHMQAGDAAWKSASTMIGGTASHRRGEEAGIIAKHQKDWAKIPPQGYDHLQHLETFTMGDFNMPIDCERMMLSVSTGMSNNGFEQHDVKYPGQYHLFKEQEPVVPENYLEVREPVARSKGAHKQIDPQLVEEAEQENKFTGTDNDGALSHQSPKKIIDVMTLRKDGEKLGEFNTNIVSIGNGKVATSDHFGVEGVYDFDQPYKKRHSDYENSKPEKFKAKDPSAGWMEGVKKRFRLFPSGVKAEKEIGVDYEQSERSIRKI